MITMFEMQTSGPIIMSSDTKKSVTRQGRPRKQKLYNMTYDSGRAGPEFELENHATLAPAEGILRAPPGRRGFPDYPEAPRFLFEKAGRLPRDLELFHEYWLVSDRAKSVFEAVDPAGFAFLACDVRLPSGDYDGPAYWLCDVVRVLDALDEAQSRLRIGVRDDGKKYYSITGGAELVFRDGAIGDAHVFRMAYMVSGVICDQAMKVACKAAGLKGIRFHEVSKL